jgi:hypothetical protein
MSSCVAIDLKPSLLPTEKKAACDSKSLSRERKKTYRGTVLRTQ